MDIMYLDDEDDEQSMLEDLQLAAELGKTLLERNKELETCLKQHQNIIEDQTQEIEYLTKQTAALREVNDSRLRIYEQLEVSIQDLERANQRLALDNSADKKHIKNLCLSIDSLEARCEELQRALDDMTMQADSERRRRKSQTIANPGVLSNGVPSSPLGTKGDEENKDLDNNLEAKDSLEDDEVTRLCAQLQELRSQRMKDQRKVSELGEQLATVLQENMSLEEQVTILKQREEDLKSLQEEISTLEEVRQGHLCGRCLRTVDSRGHDELSLMLDNEEEEDVSVVNSCISETHCSTVMLHIQEQDPVIEDTPRNDNPYRVLVEKYEALLEMQRHPASTRQQQEVPSNNCLSLQEELQMSGDFNSFTSKVDVESDQEQTEPHELPNKGRVHSKNGQQKAFSATPTDFSEAETSSSGFSDETSNKATQTDSNLPPGSFLCSIADGDDCRFSIYDDASPIESRFRKTPEYRQLFREIFAVLKRAAEAKDEGEKLPLLEDLTPISEAPRVPPVTPAKEELPEDFTRADKAKAEKQNHSKGTVERKLPSKENICHDKTGKTSVEPQSNSTSKKEEILEPLTLKEVVPSKSKQGPKQDILEYLSVGVGIRKKSNGRKNSPVKKATVAERVEHIESLPSSGNDGTSYASRTCNHTPRKKRDFRNSERYRMSESQERVGRESPGTWGDWLKKEVQTSTPEPQKPPGTRPSNYQRLEEQGTWDFHPFVSSASQEVAKLKRLEKSYAEVLRLGPQKPPSRAKNGYRK